MKTYLNELHQQYKENRSNNYMENSSSSKNENIPHSKLTKNKSGLLLNNYLRSTNNKNNKKINNSYKRVSNGNNNISISNNLKNLKKKKNINVTPYQGLKNEHILNLAMNNLNKYQDNLLLKEIIGNNWNENNSNLITMLVFLRETFNFLSFYKKFNSLNKRNIFIYKNYENQKI